MLNIVIPMAGAGSRFRSVGYTLPKPLIEVGGVPMIRLVISNLTPHRSHRFIFICQEVHVTDYDLVRQLTRWSPGCEIVTVDGLTRGAACTVLAAKHLINSDDQLMIANSDQYIDKDINNYLELMDNGIDGLIMTMRASDPKWSYVGMQHGNVTRVVEKQVISNEATVGIYNFLKGKDFVDGALSMIERNETVNGEFYVAPVYNHLIESGSVIKTFNVGEEGAGMYGLGIPQDLEIFLRLPVSEEAVRRVL